MITKIKIHGYRIYKDFTLKPNRKLNLIAGANESGKSTLMEAIALVLTGRINGRTASEELNPYWFNTDFVAAFVRQRAAGNRVPWPEIRIELFLENGDELQQFCGAHNTDIPTNACPGIAMRILPDPEYDAEREEWAKEASPLLPVEYYMVDWRSFDDAVITSRPKQLATAIIDSRTVRSSSGVDYHMRNILGDGLQPAERAAISTAYRKMKASMSDSALANVNARIADLHASLHNKPIVLAMDQSARTSWEGVVTPHVNNVPFSMSGQGQQAAIKISLAMSRHSERAAFVMIEEPENHLTHTSLTTLLSRMESLAGDSQQLFIATHSSFIINRLGLDSLHLLGGGNSRRLSELSAETVAYFRKLPGYDTLRMVLAEKLVLVEGPSDEIIFERIFCDKYKVRPMGLGIDVLSMRGLSLSRCLELCAALDKTVAVLRDNDGTEPDELRLPLKQWLASGKRDVFIGALAQGRTLEPQLIHHNDEKVLREILGIANSADLEKWMQREKTEAAIRIASAPQPIKPPKYMLDAAVFIHG
ncbi:ATP-dependent nuclease [Sorangium sp. So ce124]|uniref:ATP-dependent nuclease n=1 Tax=Sorangium sp. So ce124 TaxID=3133280 RepID=UPI003F608504